MLKILTGLLAIAILQTPAFAQSLDLQGHRGARGVMPENTLPGFAYTLTTGVTTLEFDLGVSKDGTVIVNHNRTLSPALVRGGDGKYVSKDAPAFVSLTLEQIKSYDVGSVDPNSRYRGRFADQKQMNGVPIPTLAEVFDLAKKAGNDIVRFNIETKLHPEKPGETLAPEAFAAAVLDVVKAHGLTDRVTIQSFDWRTLTAVQKAAPAVTTAYLSAQQKWLDNIALGKDGASPWTAGLDIDDFTSLPDMVAKAGGDVWSPFHGDVDQAAIDRAHELGLKVKVWTVNDAARMEELIGMGVDGIITDFPAMLREVMEKKGLELPTPTPVTL